MDSLRHVGQEHAVSALDELLGERDRSVRPPLSDFDIDIPEENRHPSNDDQEGALFASQRARLFRIAYRMLGSRSDADDLVQDVYLRWHQLTRDDIESPIAFLVTITTRLCVDRLRKLKRCVEFSYPCPPEYLAEDHAPSPETQLEFSEDVSMALLAVLERLGPEERAAFLLHDVLDYDYHETGRMLSKTESACRQIIHRARAHLRDSRARYAVTRESCERVVKNFLAAIGAGDREAVMALLAEELECMAVWINTHFLFDRQEEIVEG